MRVDSCRKCGTALKTKKKCSVCNEPLQFNCNNCHFETDEQIHLQCRLIDMDYKLLDAEAV